MIIWVTAVVLTSGAIDLSCRTFWDERGTTARMTRAFATDRPAADHFFKLIIPDGERPSLLRTEPEPNFHRGEWSGRRLGDRLIFKPKYGKDETGSGSLVFWFPQESQSVQVAWDLEVSLGGHIGFASYARGDCKVIDAKRSEAEK